jgi:predicted permease
MSNFASNLRFALRGLARQPGVSLLTIAMLALGIAGATSIFSIFNGLFLRPLPFHEPRRLLDLDEIAPKWNLEFVGIAYPDFDQWRRENRTFEGMAVWDDVGVNVVHGDSAEYVNAALVTHDLLKVLGLKPVLGRGFTAEEDRPGGPLVALLGYDFWQRMFQGRRDAVGQSIKVNGQSYTIIGVLPREAVMPDRAEMWAALRTDATENRGWYLNGVGRLKPGVTIEQARADLTRIHKAMIPNRNVNEITSPRMMPLRERYLGDYRTATNVLLAAVGVVLVIACVNIAGLMLARGTARSREMGIRAAMGASRGRIAAQLLTESLAVAAIGGTLGAALGVAGVRGLVALLPDQLPRWVSFETDWRFLVFALAAPLGAAVLFGLWPAIDAARVSVTGALHEATARASASAGRRRSLNALVVFEVALAVTLLVASGLLVQAFRRLTQVNPGYRTENVLLYSVRVPAPKYEKPETRRLYYARLLERMRALAGVRDAGVCTAPPMGGHWGTFFQVENAPPRPANEQDPVVLQRLATPGYLEAMGIALKAGRTFREGDGRDEKSRVMIVNETFAKLFFPDVDPVGRRVKYRGDGPWMTVVGVARDIKHYGLEREMRPGVYIPLDQNPPGSASVVMRTSVDPASVVAAARAALREIDPEIPMYRVITMAERVRDSIWVRRTYSTLIGAFAAVALLLAVGGIYGVISYSVSQRTREIGIRMALGAEQSSVLRQVLARGMAMASAGAAIGLAGAFVAARYMESMLFGVKPGDPPAYAVAAAMLIGVALVANLFPARRAAAVDPMRALRVE